MPHRLQAGTGRGVTWLGRGKSWRKEGSTLAESWAGLQSARVAGYGHRPQKADGSSHFPPVIRARDASSVTCVTIHRAVMSSWCRWR